MGLHHRKLTEEEDCDSFCHVYESCPSDSACIKCIKACLSNLNPPPPDHDQTKHTKIPTYLIISFSVVATAFFVLCCYAIYAKFFRNRSRRGNRASSSPRRQQHPREEETGDEFVDEEHGPMVDHPIWYIRTTGLNQSIISAIAVCKYKKGEGLIEGTECSVCLSEFQQDESLRLLPKCNHAFHLPCIDTWLRSHTNCPMCRAPIVTNPARVPSMEPNVFNSTSLGQSDQVLQSLENSGIQENIGGADDDELRNGSEEVEVEGGGTRVNENEVVINVPPRRSVSLDSSSAAKISAAVVASVEDSHRNSKRGSSSRTRHLESAPGSMKRSRSFNGKHLTSWYSRGQKSKPNAPVRSF